MITSLICALLVISSPASSTDDPTTAPDERYYGSWFDDLRTPFVREDRIGTGFDAQETRGINEGAAGLYDDPTTRFVNERALGSGFDDVLTPGINEGAVRPLREPRGLDELFANPFPSQDRDPFSSRPSAFPQE